MGKFTNFFPYAEAAVLVFLDRITKNLVTLHLKAMPTLPVLKIGEREIFNFTYCENRGAAFSILQGKQAFLIVITSLFMLVLLGALVSGKVKSLYLRLTLATILAGGVGNLIDRAAQGYVVDFIEFRLFSFAVFNVADICAVVGTLLLLAYIIFSEKFGSETADKNEISL